MTHPFSITTCYGFFPLDTQQVNRLRAELIAFGAEHAMKGLVLIAPEGINATVCGSADAIAAWKDMMRTLCADIVFKDSHADQPIFKRWSVKAKPEIVAIKQPDIAPRGKRNHLRPDEWDAMLSRDDVIVLDTRNDYEVAIGKFHGAIDPAIEHFSEFPAFIKNAGIPKDKKVLMYCTGGIRCEKAIIAMEKEGYENVYQLEGGILAYLEKFPHGKFDGECFVFDERVAVDQNLQPSKTFTLCPDCGDPVKVTPAA